MLLVVDAEVIYNLQQFNLLCIDWSTNEFWFISQPLHYLLQIQFPRYQLLLLQVCFPYLSFLSRANFLMFWLMWQTQYPLLCRLQCKHQESMHLWCTSIELLQGLQLNIFIFYCLQSLTCCLVGTIVVWYLWNRRKLYSFRLLPSTRLWNSCLSMWNFIVCWLWMQKCVFFSFLFPFAKSFLISAFNHNNK